MEQIMPPVTWDTDFACKWLDMTPKWEMDRYA